MVLPGLCRLLQSLFSHPSSRDGLSHRCRSLVPLILPEGSCPQPVDAVQGLPGVRPELVIRWGPGDADGQARLIAEGTSFVFGGLVHRRGAPAASGAGAFCCTRLSIALLLLLPPFLPVFLPGRSPSPCPLSAHPGWHPQLPQAWVRSCQHHRHSTRHSTLHSMWQPVAGL